jgi:DNA-binding NarL/FixJ family response regulator
MATNRRLNIKVLVVDTDFYALRALNSYLAWDRRTRVVALTTSVDGALDYIASVAPPEHPDVVLLDVDACPDSEALQRAITRLLSAVKDLVVVCITRRADPVLTSAAAAAGARGMLLRNELRLQLVGATIYALDHRFIVTPGIVASAKAPHDDWLDFAETLPGERAYPAMSDRIRQALWLTVVEGMPAQLAADEMGISPHTLRSYVKEGYRILETADDDADIPEEISPLERAFMRFTALEKTRKAALNVPDDVAADNDDDEGD